VSKIALYQLHAPDPRVALKRSVSALAELLREGLVERIGLCNVDRDALETAMGWAPISSVQVACSPFADDPLFGGVLDLCEQHGIPLIAHTPLGGARARKKLARSVVAEVAARRDATPAAAALGWLRDLSPVMVPIPGPSRMETARSAPVTIDVTADDRVRLDAALPASAWIRHDRHRRPERADGREVVLLMGIQAAGKSSTAAAWIERGHRRLNRDEAGGRLADLNRMLDRGLSEGHRLWVLDNTYAKRAQRARVLQTAWRHGTAVRCVWLDTPLPEAQINAVRRLLDRHGRLPGPEELKALQKKDPQAFDPRAQFRFQRELEPPAADEGFVAIERLPFERAASPHRGAGLVVQLEGVLRSSRSGARVPTSAEDLVVDHRRAEALRARAGNAVLVGISWQPGIAAGSLTLERAEKLVALTCERLQLEIDVRICPHAAGPPKCWCRTPLPGLAVQLVDEHQLDPARCTMVGKSAPDKTLATRMGFAYVDHDTFFAS
jgi:histidinol phosphatase-like enzyme